MRHWLQLGTRNWRTRPARAALAALAITLGVAVVVWVTCCYESVRVSVTKAVLDWIGRSHIMVEPRAGVWGCFSQDLADEPTGNLDPTSSVEIWRLMQDLSRETGTTILMVTHEAAAAAHAHRVYVLKEGQFTGTIDAQGTGDETLVAARYAELAD